MFFDKLIKCKWQAQIKRNGRESITEVIKENLYRNELELKFKIRDFDEYESYKSKLKNSNLKYISTSIETDFTPDTQDFLCKKENIMLRYRILSDKNYLLTLKIKQKNSNVQDNLEIEYYSHSLNFSKHNEINKVLLESIGIEIPIINLMGNNIAENVMEIATVLYDIGFTTCRMLSQKKRTLYKSTDESVCFDTFPDSLGTYMELESFYTENLNKLVDLISPSMSQLEEKNYGKLIQSFMEENGRTGLEKRVCVFDKELEKDVLTKFGK